MNSNPGQDLTGDISPPAASRYTAPQRPSAASDGTTGVYGITVAAELTQMSVQALRLYERKGLLTPTRTDGGTRRYSDTDIARLRRISTLINDGINLTGIARVLDLEADNAALHTTNTTLRARNADLSTTNAVLRQRSTGPAAADGDGPTRGGHQSADAAPNYAPPTKQRPGEVPQDQPVPSELPMAER